MKKKLSKKINKYSGSCLMPSLWDRVELITLLDDNNKRLILTPSLGTKK